MAIITSRAEFKAKCLRRLGDGVIQVNISDDQAEDCIDDAMKMYYDFHYDGTELQYYKYVLTSTDITNKYITLPANITGATRIFPIGGISGAGSSDILFNVQYHLIADQLYNLNMGAGPSSLVPYYMTMQHLTLIQELLVGQQPVRYNRNVNRLYIDMDWRKVLPGVFLMVEVYQIVDPVANPTMWNDRWLQFYTRALMMEQWGTNLIKFPNIALPGGVNVNGSEILDRGLEKKKELEEELRNSYSAPPLDMIG